MNLPGTVVHGIKQVLAKSRMPEYNRCEFLCAIGVYQVFSDGSACESELLI